MYISLQVQVYHFLNKTSSRKTIITVFLGSCYSAAKLSEAKMVNVSNVINEGIVKNKGEPFPIGCLQKLFIETHPYFNLWTWVTYSEIPIVKKEFIFHRLMENFIQDQSLPALIVSPKEITGYSLCRNPLVRATSLLQRMMELMGNAVFTLEKQI